MRPTVATASPILQLLNEKSEDIYKLTAQETPP